VGGQPLDDLAVRGNGADAQPGKAKPLGEAVNRDRAFRIEARGENMPLRKIPIGAIVE
jgi:hypothetical protein